MSFAQVVDTRATRPFPSSPPTNLGKEKGRRRQTSGLSDPSASSTLALNIQEVVELSM